MEPIHAGGYSEDPDLVVHLWTRRFIVVDLPIAHYWMHGLRRWLGGGVMVDGSGVGSAEAQVSSAVEKSQPTQDAEKPPDPDAVLRELLEEEASVKARAAAVAADVKALTAAIGALTTNRKDIVKEVDAYAKADYPKAIATAKSLADEKLACIENKLGPRLEKARKLVDDFAKEVDTVKSELEGQIKSPDSATDTQQAANPQRESKTDAKQPAIQLLESANRKLESANKRLAAATASFGKSLSLTKDYAAPAGGLTTLQSQLKAAIDNADTFGAFAIYREIIRQTEELAGQLPTPGEYEKQLVSQWNAVERAQQNARVATKTVAGCQSDVDRLKVRYAALTTDRVAELRRRWNMELEQGK
ncbi:hypothetical protein [Rhodococcus sp. IEGM 1307]|uniref:hypothetical protein n=1 Tax=Rhodococcus sp. IEGM 1307 TaxID=3047091 RepID=UPI0024B82529|nr:hypothetical protein [Rhodococcus sp. IEGM 1307]MDI9978781.1 hypothetical protein [Rhodococcus sp. IEGM 1307]